MMGGRAAGTTTAVTRAKERVLMSRARGQQEEHLAQIMPSVVIQMKNLRKAKLLIANDKPSSRL